MRKLLYALLLAVASALPAMAQWPGPGFWQPQFQNPLQITGTTYTIGPAAPVILVNSATGIAISLPVAWCGQRYDIFLGASASANGSAIFTASGSGTSLTVSAVAAGTITIGSVISGTGITDGTEILSQSSGTTGGIGLYVTSVATTASNSTVASGAITASPNGADTWMNGTSGPLLIGSYGLHTALLAVGNSSGGCSWVATN